MKFSIYPSTFDGEIEWDEYEDDIVAFLIAADSIQLKRGAKLFLTVDRRDLQVQSWFLDGFYEYAKCIAELGPTSGEFDMIAQDESGALVVVADNTQVRVSVEAPDGTIYQEVLEPRDWSEFLIGMVTSLAGRLDARSTQFADRLCQQIRSTFTQNTRVRE